MKRTARLRYAALCISLALSVSLPAFSQTPTTPVGILARANESYYNLKREGLLKLTCAVAPNYDVILADLRKSNPAGADSRLEIYSKVQMMLAIGAHGDAAVSRTDKAGATYNGVAYSISQTVSSFVEMWRPIVFVGPFSGSPGTYQLDDLGAQYRISNVNGTSRTVTMMDKDMTLTVQIITSPDVNTVLWSQFTTTPKGLLPARFDNDWRVPGKSGPVHASTTITYQQVSGLQVPKTFRTRTTSDAGTIDFEASFTGCTATKR